MNAIRRTRGLHVVATFDDGPHPERTPRVLDLLAASGARAVFFVVGRNAERRPDLLRRIRDEGHAIGNHTWSHPVMPLRSTRTIEDELDRCQAIVTSVTGSSPTLARPPYGLGGRRYYAALEERNLTPVLWSLDSRDYLGTAASRLAARLGRAGAGDIVLMHDGDPKARHLLDALDRWFRSKPAVGLL